MYSSTCNNANNPISYSTLYDAFPDDIEHYSKQEDSHSFLFHFSSPNTHSTVADDDDNVAILKHFQDLLLQQQTLTMANCALPDGTMNTANLNKNEGMPKGMATKQMHAAKRTCKKDRHSKIDTARGPRDRRMRLSLEVARKFFDLQDMLGFDKASKTVEWLLRMSKAAIKEVAGETKHSESASALECGMISFNKKKTPTTAKEERKVIRALRRRALQPLARESRARARARARELTREKRRLHQSKLCFGAMNQLGSWTPFETGEELGTRSIQSVDLSRFDVLSKVDDEPPPPPISISHKCCNHLGKELTEDDDIAGDSLVITGNWSSSIIFNCQHNPGSPSQEHQSIDFQFYGKQLEAYNMNLS